jgi:hypothetical protein
MEIFVSVKLRTPTLKRGLELELFKFAHSPLTHSSIMSSQQRRGNKRKSTDLVMKYQAIKSIEDGKSQAQVCKELDLNKKTLSGWWKNRDSLKSQFESNKFAPSTKIQRTGT